MPRTKKNKDTNTTAELAERAMLVRKETSCWHGVKADRSAAQQYADSKHASSRMFRVSKRLIPQSALRPIYSAFGLGDKAHRHYTLPWRDDGYRILSSPLYFEYMESQQRAREELATAVGSFCDQYMDIFREGRELLGEAADTSDYPATRDELERRFRYEVHIVPLPAAGDFRVGLQGGDADAIRQQIETDVREAVAQGLKDPFQRLYKAVEHMVDRLNSYNVDAQGKVHNSFRDSLVANVSEVIKIFPALNLTNDKKLAAMATQIEKALVVSPEVLRDDEKKRKATASEAEKILKKLEQFI